MLKEVRILRDGALRSSKYEKGSIVIVDRWVADTLVSHGIGEILDEKVEKPVEKITKPAPNAVKKTKRGGA